MLYRLVKMLILAACLINSAAALPALCKDDNYICHRVKSGQSWNSLFQDPTDRGIVMRINHTNQALYKGRVIVIPKNLANANLLEFSPLPLTWEGEEEGEKIIIFDPAKHAFGAYDEQGRLVRWGPATGGQDWCNDIQENCKTSRGEYRIYSLGNSNCVSTKFPIPEGGAPMPYCMFFNGGQAFHGSPGGVLKGNASHGCVRLFVQDAEWLRYDFVEGPNEYNGYKGTKVLIMPYKST